MILASGSPFQLDSQTNDWRVLQKLDPGSFIGVGVLDHRGRRECTLLTVTDSELTCDSERGSFIRHLTFQRDRVRDLRLEHPENHHLVIGAVVGGAIGAIIGGLLAGRSNDPEAVTADPGLGILFGASLGAGIGRAIHKHGPVLYRKK